MESTHDAAGAAAAIGEPARARMLYALLDGRARTATELALLAEVGPSTASAHLERLRRAELVRVLAQGKHRYYSLAGSEVADVLERLSVLTQGRRASEELSPGTPQHLRAARSCYDHLAGALGVSLHDRLVNDGWLAERRGNYDVTPKGERGLAGAGIDIAAARRARRRFAYGCLDWSERRAHLGGAVGAALLAHLLAKRWLMRERGSRALAVTATGQRELLRCFGLRT